jgi:hypothetical protein
MTTRCGQCQACKNVERAKKWATPNPPFTHASDDTAAGWNQALKDNPCQRPDSRLLICAASCSNPDFEGDRPEYAVLTLSRALAAILIRRHTTFLRCKEADADLMKQHYWVHSGAAQWLGRANILNGDPDKLQALNDEFDQLERPNGVDGWLDLAGPPREEFICCVECSQICITEDGVTWITIPKGASHYVMSARLSHEFVRAVLEGQLAEATLA